MCKNGKHPEIIEVEEVEKTRTIKFCVENEDCVILSKEVILETSEK